ncbi:hypothetical protein QAD02_017042 [Eretmocerus hayati]|uniref:Uncharacterized protein n=1 Tax=Eretmocerus hayati TaxID=131215 RepID=A0ACC2PHL2_9HYME|nr:hypothetical protein QAD02_017042 [Eretmocerus hayati]
MVGTVALINHDVIVSVLINTQVLLVNHDLAKKLYRLFIHNLIQSTNWLNNWCRPMTDQALAPDDYEVVGVADELSTIQSLCPLMGHDEFVKGLSISCSFLKSTFRWGFIAPGTRLEIDFIMPSPPLSCSTNRIHLISPETNTISLSDRS